MEHAYTNRDAPYPYLFNLRHTYVVYGVQSLQLSDLRMRPIIRTSLVVRIANHNNNEAAGKQHPGPSAVADKHVET